MTTATREVASRPEAPVVVVTGSTRGIGLVIARRFLDEGARVVFHGRNALSDPEVERSVAQGRALCVLADLVDAESRATLFGRVIEKFARVDVLINNAGLQAFGPLAGHSTHDFQRMLEVNAIGASDCMRRAFEVMAKHRSGCIVNIASIRSARPGANASLYAASKAALVAMTRAAAAEFGPHGVRVNAVLPGLVWRETSPGRVARRRRRVRGACAAAAHRRAGGHRGRMRVPGLSRGELGDRNRARRRRRRVARAMSEIGKEQR